MRKILTVGLLALALVACDQAGDLGQPLPDGAETAVKVKPGFKNPAILPAYKLPGEDRVPGKQDAASDFRKAHPQWYAITEAPPAQYRPMKEWEPMQSIIITYSDYLPGDNETAQTMADIVVGSVDVGKVWVIVEADSAKNDLIDRIKEAGVTDQQIEEQIVFFNIENDAIWQIDYGPLPMVDDDAGQMIWQDFRYYHQRVLDDAIPTRLANRLNVTTYRSPFDFEGGNFQADGEEFCYTTERLYYYTGLDYDGVNDVFKTYYGCKEAVVLKDITNDGTGHVDMFFKLAGKHTAFMGEYTVVNDATNKQRMDDNVAIMDALEYSDGSAGIKTYRIPMPHAGQAGSETVPRTYINSTLFVSADGTKKVNLWPMYTVDKDLEAEALDAWEEGLPGWDHIGVVSDQISFYSGAIHCVTRTVPALPLTKAIADGTCTDGACQGGEGAYDGACVAGSEEDPGCWGPQWECLCNICSGAGCEIPDSCGDGTCAPSENCFSCAADCGCGVDEVCNVVSGACGKDTCGNGTCEEEENCLSCAADCGCKGGESCSFGICTDDPCGGITYDGCCDGDDTLVYCDGGDLVVNGCQGAGCGWLADQEWYDCTGVGEDPSGAKPLDCGEFAYPPGCDGKNCGDNGGGYLCGECDEGVACVDGVCDGSVECSCDGLECGEDNCGNSCGECEDGFMCDGGACIAEVVNPESTDSDIVTGEEITTNDEVVDGPEITTEQDAIEGGVDATDNDVAGEKPKTKSDDGCTAGSGGSSSGMALVFLALLAVLGIVRRRSVLA